MAVNVPNPYGQLTYMQGTTLRYLGQQGARLIVQKGDEEFTVTPRMVTADPASAAQ